MSFRHVFKQRFIRQVNCKLLKYVYRHNVIIDHGSIFCNSSRDFIWLSKISIRIDFWGPKRKQQL